MGDADNNAELPAFEAGPLTATILNRFRDAIESRLRALVLQKTRGGTTHVTPHGQWFTPTPVSGSTVANDKELSAHISSGGTQVTIYWGTIDGMPADGMDDPDALPPYSLDIEVSDGDSILARVYKSYDMDTGLWSTTNWDLYSAATLPAATDSFYYLPLSGPCTLVDGEVTAITGGDGGSKTTERCGSDVTYVDKYGLATA